MSIDNELKNIAQNLKADAQDFENESYLEIEGVKITYPYASLDYYADSGFFPHPSHVWDSKIRLHNLFTKDLPNEWLSYLKDINKERIASGSDTPLDLITGSAFIIAENPEKCKELGLTQYPRNEDGWYDYSDTKHAILTVNTILTDPVLRKALTNSLIVQVFDQGGDMGEDDVIPHLYEKLALKNKVVLDIGCGTGEKTADRADKIGVKTIGLERQFHSLHYKEFWRNDTPNLNFVRADAASGIPLKSGSIDFALMEWVVPHLNQSGLENILKETTRVLKPGGILMVGPETYYYKGEEKGLDTNWRYYIKEEKGGFPNLKRITLSEVKKEINRG